MTLLSLAVIHATSQATSNINGIATPSASNTVDTLFSSISQYFPSKLLLFFIVLNIITSAVGTFKTIITVRSNNKAITALVNAIDYMIYTVVLVYVNIDGISLLAKSITMGASKFIGVFIVKYIEEKARKDKLWKVELTTSAELQQELHDALNLNNIPHNYIPNIGKWTLFSCYCSTRAESKSVRDIAHRYGCKTFVIESDTTFDA